MRIVTGLFGKVGAIEFLRTIDFICGDMIEQFITEIIFPIFLCCLQQIECAQQIGLVKEEWLYDASVYMTLSSEVYHAIDLFCCKKLFHKHLIADISVY